MPWNGPKTCTFPLSFIVMKILKQGKHSTRELSCLKSVDVELVVMAGFMRIITLFYLMPIRTGHEHSPCPSAFIPGMHAQRQAVDYGVRFSGCTVHFVDQGVDSGPIIIQAVVPVLDEDTEETLSARILKEEPPNLSPSHSVFCRMTNFCQ
jgi:folate-dependent phosphoribosylglycinamide formyltransferase PurN